MRIVFCLALCLFCAVAQASSTLRVGSKVLTAGDTAARVTALLGKPSYKSRSGRSSRRGRGRAERWQYRRGNRITTVILVAGRVTDIEESRL